MSTVTNLEARPINDPKKMVEHMNEFRLIEAVKKCIERIDKLEKMFGVREEKPKKALTQIGNYAPYIHEMLSNGKIWSTWTMAEELALLHPELPPATQVGIAACCGRLHKKGIITKVGKGAYRKKQD